MKNIIRCTNFLFLTLLFFTCGYSQKEGIFKFSTENLPSKYDSSRNLPEWLSNMNSFTKIWFKDSCVVYELRIRYETRDQTPQGTIVKKSYPVWRYVYLDLRTMICQDYQHFKDTATPFCNYFIKPEDTLRFLNFFSKKTSLDITQKKILLSDTVINRTIFKRIKVFYKYYPQQNFYTIYYQNCNVPQNIFYFNTTLNKTYPGCKTVIGDFFDSTGNLLIRDKYEILTDKLTLEEKNIFKQWYQNSLKTKLPLLPYEEAIRSCISNYEHENPTIKIIPNKKSQE